MLKLFKWIYDLGANQENARIKSIIEQTRVEADYAFKDSVGIFRGDESSKEKKRRAALDQQGQIARIQLIDAITLQTGEYVLRSPIDRPKVK